MLKSGHFSLFDRLTNALTTLRSVNKTDVVTLSSNFGSLASMMNASREELVQCPGKRQVGEVSGLSALSFQVS